MSALLPHPGEAWLAAVVETGLAAAALALVALVVDRWAGRGRWPRLRHALWALVAIRLVLPAGVTSPVGLLPGPSAGGSVGAGAPAEGGSAEVLFFAWALGVAALATRALLRRRALGRWIRERGEPVPREVRRALRAAARRLGLSRVPRAVVLPGLGSPAVAGLLRAVVLVPPDSPRGAALEHALLHEAGHLLRRDLWVQAAFGVVAALSWFHPAAWLARSRSRDLREIGCDLTVARRLGSRAGEYRRTLLEVAAARFLGAAPVGSAGWWRSGSGLLARLAALDSPARDPRLWTRAAALVAVAVLGALALPSAPGRSASPVTGDAVEEARSHLAHACAQRDRYGCFHRQEAWIRLRALEDASASPASENP